MKIGKKNGLIGKIGSYQSRRLKYGLQIRNKGVFLLILMFMGFLTGIFPVIMNHNGGLSGASSETNNGQIGDGDTGGDLPDLYDLPLYYSINGSMGSIPQASYAGEYDHTFLDDALYLNIEYKGVCKDPEDNLYLVAYKTYPLFNRYQFYLEKRDSDNNQLWQTTYTLGSSEKIIGITYSGELVWVGLSNGDDTTELVRYYSSNGTFLDVKNLDLNPGGKEYINAIRGDLKGNCYLGGSINNNFYVAKINSNGVLINQSQITITGYTQGVVKTLAISPYNIFLAGSMRTPYNIEIPALLRCALNTSYENYEKIPIAGAFNAITIDSGGVIYGVGRFDAYYDYFIASYSYNLQLISRLDITFENLMDASFNSIDICPSDNTLLVTGTQVMDISGIGTIGIASVIILDDSFNSMQLYKIGYGNLTDGVFLPDGDAIVCGSSFNPQTTTFSGITYYLYDTYAEPQQPPIVYEKEPIENAQSGMIRGGNELDIDTLGNKYITGYIYAADGTRNVYAAKMDSENNVIWNITWGGGLDDYGMAVSLSADEAYLYVVGVSQSYSLSESHQNKTGFCLKLRSDTGALIWQYILPITSSSTYSWVAVSHDDSSIYVSGATVINDDYMNKAFLQRIDSNGTSIWLNYYDYDGPYSEFPTAIAVSYDDNFIYQIGNLLNNSVYVPFIIKWSNLGEILSDSNIASNDSFYFGFEKSKNTDIFVTSIDIDPDTQQLIVVGYKMIDGDKSSTMFIYVLLPENLIINWTQHYGFTYATRIYGLKVTHNAIYTSGDILYDYSPIKKQSLLIRWDKKGNLVWKRYWGLEYDSDVALSVKLDNRGNIYTAGFHKKNDFSQIALSELIPQNRGKWIRNTYLNNYTGTSPLWKPSFSKDGYLYTVIYKNNTNYSLLKFDYWGDLVWNSTVEQNDVNEIPTIITSNDAKYVYLIGTCQSDKGFIEKKYSVNGTTIWNSTYDFIPHNAYMSKNDSRIFIIGSIDYGGSDTYISLDAVRTDTGGLMRNYTINGLNLNDVTAGALSIKPTDDEDLIYFTGSANVNSTYSIFIGNCTIDITDVGFLSTPLNDTDTIMVASNIDFINERVYLGGGIYRDDNALKHQNIMIAIDFNADVIWAKEWGDYYDNIIFGLKYFNNRIYLNVLERYDDNRTLYKSGLVSMNIDGKILSDYSCKELNGYVFQLAMSDDGSFYLPSIKYYGSYQTEHLIIIRDEEVSINPYRPRITVLSPTNNSYVSGANGFVPIIVDVSPGYNAHMEEPVRIKIGNEWTNMSDVSDGYFTRLVKYMDYSSDNGVKVSYLFNVSNIFGTNAILTNLTFNIDNDNPSITQTSLDGLEYITDDFLIWVKATDPTGEISKATLSIKEISGEETSYLPIRMDYNSTAGRYEFSWRAASNLWPEGKYNLTVTVYDKAGNSISDNRVIKLDYTPPAIHLINAYDNMRISGKRYLEFEIYDSYSGIITPQIKIDDGAYQDLTNHSGKTYYFMLNTEASIYGTIKVTVKTSNIAGLTSIEEYSFSIDNFAPNGYIRTNATMYDSNTIVISGQTVITLYCSDSYGGDIGRIAWRMDDKPFSELPVANTQQFTIISGKYKDGEHTLQILIEDNAIEPNSAILNYSIIVDNTKPQMAITGLIDGGAVRLDDSIEIKVYDGLAQNCLIYYSIDESDDWIPITFDNNTGTWSLEISQLNITEGTHSISFMCIDPAGNIDIDTYLIMVNPPSKGALPGWAIALIIIGVLAAIFVSYMALKGKFKKNLAESDNISKIPMKIKSKVGESLGKLDERFKNLGNKDKKQSESELLNNKSDEKKHGKTKTKKEEGKNT